MSKISTINWPWAILLCKFSDIPTEPEPVQYYIDLYTQNGTGGVCDYWSIVSYNNLNLTGSSVFGWFKMNHSSSELAQLIYPADRRKLVEWGIETAVMNGINLTTFKSLIVIQNFGSDHGATDNGILIVHKNSALCEYGFICHEMGHGFGLSHSYSANPDTEYGDGWDIMSFAATTPTFNISFKGTTGAASVGLNAFNIEKLGVMPSTRIWKISKPDFSEWLTLEPLNQPPIGSQGFLVAKILPTATRPIRSSNSTFIVEFRQKAGWDKAIPQNAVLIHEIRKDGLSYLQPYAGGQFIAGQRFFTPDPKVFLKIVNIDPTSMTASIRIWDLVDGCLRKEDSKPDIYMITSGQKRLINSPQVLTALGRSLTEVRSIPDGELNNVPTGTPVKMMNISFSPIHISLNKPIRVIVSAKDVVTNLPVLGTVRIDGLVVGNTNTPFTYTFKTTTKHGSVSAPNYNDVEIDVNSLMP